MHIVKNYLTLPFLLNLLHGAHNIPLRRKTSGRSKKTQEWTHKLQNGNAWWECERGL